MRTFHYVLWQDDLDPALTDAVSAAAGGAEVALLSTWWSMSKDGGEDPPEALLPAGAVTLDWMGHGPGAAMEIAVSGPGLPPALGEADFGRSLARTLGRPLLFSDCHIFPLSYFMAREDGAIVHVVVSDDDAMALLPEDPADPDCWERDVLFAPGEALPTQPDDEDLDADPPERCAVFAGRCPKRKFVCVRTRG